MVSSPEAGSSEKQSRQRRDWTKGPSSKSRLLSYFRSRVLYGVQVHCVLRHYDYITTTRPESESFINSLKVYKSEVHPNRRRGRSRLFSTLPPIAPVLSIVALSGRLFSWSFNDAPASETYSRTGFRACRVVLLLMCSHQALHR